MVSMPLLFSYGTLQELPVQLATFGRPLRGHADELPEFASARVPIKDPDVTASSGRTYYDNAVPAPGRGARVAGTAFEVTDAELVAADEYERDADYVRIVVVLASGQPAWVYVHRPGDRQPSPRSGA